MKKLVLSILLFPSLLMANELKLVGKALLEYSIFKIDVYDISYFKGKTGQEKLVLDYKTDVKKEISKQGWEVGLKHLIQKSDQYKKKANWIINTSVDLKEGDSFVIKKNNEQVTILKNNVVIANIQDELVSKIIFEPWLGENPVDKDVKRKLLGEL